MKQYIFSILTFFLCFACCKKKASTPSLPAPTQIGANTFGFLLDGIPFINTSQYVYNQWNCTNGNEVIKKNNPLEIYSVRCMFNGNNYNTAEIYINLYGSIEPKNYPIGDGNTGTPINNISCRYYSDYYISQAADSFQVALTKSSNGVLSGTFFGTLHCIEKNKTIIITSGRFDLPY